jgi:hypothetical protein
LVSNVLRTLFLRRLWLPAFLFLCAPFSERSLYTQALCTALWSRLFTTDLGVYGGWVEVIHGCILLYRRLFSFSKLELELGVTADC